MCETTTAQTVARFMEIGAYGNKTGIYAYNEVRVISALGKYYTQGNNHVRAASVGSVRSVVCLCGEGSVVTADVSV
jgi:urea transporter